MFPDCHKTAMFEPSAGKDVLKVKLFEVMKETVKTPFIFHPPPNLCLCLSKSSGGDFFLCLILGCQRAAELCILCFLLVQTPHFICSLTIMHFMMTVAFENSVCFHCRYRQVCSYFGTLFFDAELFCSDILYY